MRVWTGAPTVGPVPLWDKQAVHDFCLPQVAGRRWLSRARKGLPAEPHPAWSQTLGSCEESMLCEPTAGASGDWRVLEFLVSVLAPPPPLPPEALKPCR